MKILFIYEELFPPYDEGMKKFSFMIHNELLKAHKISTVRDLKYLPAPINSLLIVPRILVRAIGKLPEIIIYIPKQSLTFFSLMKLWFLGIVFGQRVRAIGLQKRQLADWQATLVAKLNFPPVLVLSKSMTSDLEKIGIQSQTIMAGIDCEKFRPLANKDELKTTYGIPVTKRVLLHVGHIRESRNIEWLGHIQKNMPEIQVLLIGSSTTSQEENIYNNLKNDGVLILREALPNIEEVYQLSDWYCFPVKISSAAMEIPLSVLEAMSVNLPVLTTHFGRLTELFIETSCFHYVDNWHEVASHIRQGFGENCRNREQAKQFSWQSTVQKLIDPAVI